MPNLLAGDFGSESSVILASLLCLFMTCGSILSFLSDGGLVVGQTLPSGALQNFDDAREEEQSTAKSMPTKMG